MDMTYTVHHNMHDCMEAFQLDVTPQYLLFVNPVSVPVIWGKLLIWDPKEEEWINHQNENNNARPLQPKVIKHPKTRKQNVEHADRVNLEWNCLPSSDNKFTSKIGIMSHHNKPSSLGDEHNHSHSLLEFPNYKYIIYIYIHIFETIQKPTSQSTEMFRAFFLDDSKTWDFWLSPFESRRLQPHPVPFDNHS